MKLRSYAAIILGSAVVVSNMPAIAQMAPDMPKADVAAPTTEAAPLTMPKASPPEPADAIVEMPDKPTVESVEAPATTPIAPTTTPAVPPTLPTEVAAPEVTQPSESESMPLPTLESTPTAPMAAPTATTTNGPVPAAMTQVLPEESITGVATVSMPEPSPIQAGDFTLPIALKVAQDVNVLSSTPISDRYTGKENWNLAAWTAGIRNCLQQKPKLMRVVGEQSVPFMLNGAEGSIVLNANNKAVCPI
ncbi:hypothetical protein IQ266_21555 [filamentous cyanobacterium LEGE 11480]|uniref:Uncharacterized protein n=1 Tax=Romeriopsis navalis LEGE 11480 TaxID=2777977 RepID=A0A928Z677_9CYAN|nr:hypothetical protein [Romeriopsis navalis]MBE9032328.1 hypothetical protein [Romeriopsis navalis LEGE 11480]